MSDRRGNREPEGAAEQSPGESPRLGIEPVVDTYEPGSGRGHGGRVRVVVAEDSYMIREFLISVLNSASDLELVGVCTTSRELQLAVSSLHPDVIVTDIRMPPAWTDDGIRIAARLRETNPEIGVVILSQYADPSYALALLARGTQRRSYLLKERIRNSNDLIAAIKAVAEGGSVIDPAIVDVLIEARSKAAHSRLSHLTPRERQLLGEIAAGKSNAAIATSLFLTKRAVEKHVNSIFAKLDLPETEDVSRRVAAALIYLSEEAAEPSMTAAPPR
jgi:DNA-binding NarL/FixJ family response regulator